MFPTDARLMHRARERLVRLAKKHGVKLRQPYERVGKFALIKHQCRFRADPATHSGMMPPPYSEIIPPPHSDLMPPP
jgi:hypothetical protein